MPENGFPDDESTGEVEHAQVRIQSNLPSNQYSTESIHPTMSSLDHPSSGLLSFFTLLFFLLSTTLHIGCVLLLLQKLVHFCVIIPFVQTKSLGSFLRGRGAWDHQGIEGLFQHLEVVAVGAFDRERDR